MPVHDWTRVGDFAFHGFHTRWIVHLQEHLNGGILPPGYYADSEQITSEPESDERHRPDVIALARPRTLFDPTVPTGGGILLEETPPAARRLPMTVSPRPKRRIGVRHASGHRVVAWIEIVSAGNKDRVPHVEEFAGRVAAALSVGVHVLVLDLFPPGRHDPNGLHEAIQQQFSSVTYDELPAADARTLASYTAGPGEVFLYHPRLGDPLPEVPLFLTSDNYVNVPLEVSYRQAWAGTPSIYREVLEPVTR